MNTSINRIITASIAQFCQISGLGRTRVYELLGDGSLDSVKIGKRRLVIVDSYWRLIERYRAEPQKGLSKPRRLPTAGESVEKVNRRHAGRLP